MKNLTEKKVVTDENEKLELLKSIFDSMKTIKEDYAEEYLASLGVKDYDYFDVMNDFNQHFGLQQADVTQETLFTFIKEHNCKKAFESFVKEWVKYYEEVEKDDGYEDMSDEPTSNHIDITEEPTCMADWKSADANLRDIECKEKEEKINNNININK